MTSSGSFGFSREEMLEDALSQQAAKALLHSAGADFEKHCGMSSEKLEAVILDAFDDVIDEDEAPAEIMAVCAAGILESIKSYQINAEPLFRPKQIRATLEKALNRAEELRECLKKFRPGCAAPGSLDIGLREHPAGL